MEFYILGSLLSLGYYLQEKDREKNPERYTKTMYRGNTYDHEQYDRVENQVFDRAQHKFDQAQNLYQDNTVGKYTPDVLFHKTQKYAGAGAGAGAEAGTTSTTEEPFASSNVPGAWNINDEELPYETVDGQFRLEKGEGGEGAGAKSVASAGSGIDVQQQQWRQPFEAQKDKEPFYHNNMVPFFGSTVKQNVTDNAHEGKLRMHTGQWDYARKQKQEIAPMFAPEANIKNVYGDQQFLEKMDQNIDRFIPSLMRTNEVPTERVYVTPGLNLGYQETATFGFHDPVRVLPKTTNELRAKNKPKLTFDRPVVSGKALTQSGTKRPNQAKNRPELVVHNDNGKRNFGAKAVVAGSTERPEFLLGSALRTVSKYFVGAAKSVNPSERAAAPVAGAPVKRKQTKTSGTPYVTPATAQVKKPQLTAPGARAKDTKRKEGTEANAHKGYFTSLWKGLTMYAQEPARNTVKQTTEAAGAKQKLNLKSARLAGTTVFDPVSGAAKPTVKQTTEANTQGGGQLNLKSAHVAPTVHDPEDKPAYTLKDIVKVQHYKGVSTPAVKKLTVWDPDQKAKTTVKQTTLAGNYLGGKNTTQNGGAYKVVKVAPKYTSRQDALVENYTGAAGAAVASAQDYDAAYAAETNALKEQIAVGRAPTQNSVKLAVGGDMQNVDVKRLDNDRKNPRDFEQDVPNVHVSFPQPPTTNPHGITKEKNTVTTTSNLDRMQPDILDAYRNNPYTQSLHSYVFP